MEITPQLFFMLFCIFSVIFPIIAGFINYKYLNISLKIFLFWLIFNLFYATLSTSFAFLGVSNLYMEYFNTSISYLFFYLVLNYHFNRSSKIILLLSLVVVIIVIIADVILTEDIKQRKYYSSTFQTFVWLLMSFYYLLKLFQSSQIKSLREYPFFWIFISHFTSSIVSFGYFLLTNSAINFSRQLYVVLENIAYSSVLLMYMLFLIGILKVKKGIKEIIKL